MGTVRKYMIFAALLLVYIVGIGILLRSYYVYQNAYHNLSKLISHSSVEVIYEMEE